MLGEDKEVEGAGSGCVGANHGGLLHGDALDPVPGEHGPHRGAVSTAGACRGTIPAYPITESRAATRRATVPPPTRWHPPTVPLRSVKLRIDEPPFVRAEVDIALENACYKCLFQLFQRYVASVSYGCCKNRSGCCTCCIGYTCIIQVYVLNISFVLDVCCNCFICMLHMFPMTARVSWCFRRML